MHLICLSCDSRFVVAREQLGPAGRRVRCGRCGYEWRATAAPDEIPKTDETPKTDEAPKTDRAPQTKDAGPAARLEVSDEGIAPPRLRWSESFAAGLYSRGT